jgi:hypothetical protein
LFLAFSAIQKNIETILPLRNKRFFQNPDKFISNPTSQRYIDWPAADSTVKQSTREVPENHRDDASSSTKFCSFLSEYFKTLK